MFVWYYLWPYISAENLSDVERIEVYIIEKKKLEKEF
jgi:hypothetical protein